MFGIQNVDRAEYPTSLEHSNGLANTPEAPTRIKTPIQVVFDTIRTMEPDSMVELAERYYGKSTLDDYGETRKVLNSEVIVLVPDHLRNWLENSGFGAMKINGKIHFFVGTHWQPIEDAECEMLLGFVAGRIGHDASDSKSCIFCRKLFRQFHFSLSPIANESKCDQVLINFKNGTLVISSSNEVLRDFCKTDNLNYQLPFDYDEDAKCPMFEKFLLKVLPDIESRQILSEFLGWTFLKDLKLEKALFLYGSGQNGKSVIFDIVNALLGENNIENLNLSSLSKLENRFRLGTVLLNFGSDINDRCDIDLFKRLTSGEPVEARRLYKDVFTLRNYGRLAFNANRLPTNTEHTEGFFRRFLIVPFNVTIKEEEKDPDLAKKIISSELPGVFNWVMQGLRRLRETRKFSECLAANTALSEYRKESDTVALFLDEKGFKASPEGKIGKDELYKEYQYFCTSGGYRSIVKNEFGKRLNKVHLVEDSKSGSCRFWRLIRKDPE